MFSFNLSMVLCVVLYHSSGCVLLPGPRFDTNATETTAQQCILDFSLFFTLRSLDVALVFPPGCFSFLVRELVFIL